MAASSRLVVSSSGRRNLHQKESRRSSPNNRQCESRRASARDAGGWHFSATRGGRSRPQAARPSRREAGASSEPSKACCPGAAGALIKPVGGEMAGWPAEQTRRFGGGGNLRVRGSSRHGVNLGAAELKYYGKISHRQCTSPNNHHQQSVKAKMLGGSKPRRRWRLSIK